VLKSIFREIAVFFSLLFILALLMHQDLFESPLQRFSLMQEDGNYFHPFVYTLILYFIVYFFRFLAKKVITITKKFRKQ